MVIDFYFEKTVTLKQILGEMKLFIDEKLRYLTKRSNEILQYRVVNLVNDKNNEKI